MSALGFGVAIGSLVTSVFVVPKAYKTPAAAVWLTLGGGLMGWILLPSVLGGIPDFLIGSLAVPTVMAIILRNVIRSYKLEQELEEAHRREAQRIAQERKIQATADRKDWKEKQVDWTYLSSGWIMNLPDAPRCFCMLAKSHSCVRIVTYSDDEDFQIISDRLILMSQIISLNVAAPMVTKRRAKTVPVSIVEQGRRSPVGRGLVGGALFGPAGLVLGAASGLNSKTTTRVEHQTVSESYETKGSPQLIIGTTLTDRPVLNIKFETPNLANEWMFRIQAVQFGRQ